MKPSNDLIDTAQLQDKLQQVKEDVTRFLISCRSLGMPFGRFKTCAHAYMPHELDAATAGIELWVMLDLPINEQELGEAVRYLKSFQNPDTGLVFDRSWNERDANSEKKTWEKGDTFFTVTTIDALKALGARLEYPIHYLTNLSAERLISNTNSELSAQHPFAIGDYAALVAHNFGLNIPRAHEQWIAILKLLKHSQDSTTGLWTKGYVSPPYTPSINRTFHFLRSTWNLVDHPYLFVKQMIDSCLDALDEPQYYKKGDACDDLDLAHVIYGASCWSSYRASEVKLWAAERLLQILDMQRSDGGFSYKNEKAMSMHNRIAISPGKGEGDIWGTFMYMGTIKMMTELAYPEIIVPWSFSKVHRVPKKLPIIQKEIMRLKEMVYSRLGYVTEHFTPKI
jgi:hypothetical protein